MLYCLHILKGLRPLFLGTLFYYYVGSITATEIPRLQFNNLTFEEGLSSNTTYQVVQDQKGFIWIATSSGLNRYDGNGFKVYTHNNIDSLSLSDDHIRCLYADDSAQLWIGTLGSGLNKMDLETGKVTRYLHNPKDANSLSSNEILTIFEDSEGIIWIGTEMGVNAFDPSTDRFYRFLPDEHDVNALSARAVLRIYEDTYHRLWIGTWNGGLNLLMPNGEGKQGRLRASGFRNFRTFNSDIPNDHIWQIKEDWEGRIWLATFGGGLCLMENTSDDPAPGSFEPSFASFRNMPDVPTSLCDNAIFDLEVDENGWLWIATVNGLSMLDLDQTSLQNGPIISELVQFKNFVHSNIDPNSLASNIIHDIFFDQTGLVWCSTLGGISLHDHIGIKFSTSFSPQAGYPEVDINAILPEKEDKIWLATGRKGVFDYNPRKGDWTAFEFSPNTPAGLAYNECNALYFDHSSRMWIAHRNGFTVWNKISGKQEHYLLKELTEHALEVSTVNGFFEDSQQRLWILTEGGLVKADLEAKQFDFFQHDPKDPNSICHNGVKDMVEDNRGRLWIATYNGLDRIQILEDGRFRIRHYTSSYTDPHSISSNRLNCLDYHKGQIWIGSVNGLIRYVPAEDHFVNYQEDQLLSDPDIDGLQIDDQGKVWGTTSRGLFKFDPDTETFQHYTARDGLQSNNFGQRSSYKDSDGKLFFGGIAGYNGFYPENILPNRQVPKVYLTQIHLFNKELIFDRAVYELDNIRLNYNENFLSFHFTGLSFVQPYKNQYAYKLEGLDQDWNFVGNKTFARYPNLAPGDYTLRVKAANNDGFWNEVGLSLKVTIKPAFWQANWFKGLSVLLLASGLYIFLYIRAQNNKRREFLLRKQVRERTSELEQKNKELEKAKIAAEEGAKAKASFLATMSHEIRTPMNGIIGTTELLMNTKMNAEQRELLNIVRSSGDNLLVIINDILDFSKIESGKLKLQDQNFSLRHCVENILDLFGKLAREKGLDLLYYMEPGVPEWICCDQTRLTQILSNLVNNAIKFTSKGQIYLNIKRQSDTQSHSNQKVQLYFSVKDSGIGIPEDQVSKLFQAFEQVDSSSTRRYNGTGLGLAICSRLCELMNGRIWVDSTLGKGSDFQFTIIVQQGVAEVQFKPSIRERVDILSGKEVLIVDDNEINLHILGSQTHQFGLIPTLSSDPKEALQIAKKKSFDLFILDYMMPLMNGRLLAKKIRQISAHPILVLSSAMWSPEPHDRAYIDRYANKPIRQSSLQQAIMQLLVKQTGSFSPVNHLTPAHAIQKAKSAAHLRILVAEDYEMNQKIIKRLFEKLGCQITIAEDGIEAVAMVQQTQYDLVFMDIQMPKMDGLEATQKIRTLNLSTQPIIIALTANALEEDQKRCLEQGMNDYLTKPIKAKDLRNALEKWSQHIFST